MATYETDAFKGRYPAAVDFGGAQLGDMMVPIKVPHITGGAALVGADVIKLGHLPPGFRIVDAMVFDPDGVLATFDLGFGEAISDGDAFDASGDEIIDGGAVAGADPVRGNNKLLASEATNHEKPRPIHLTALTVGAAAADGKVEVHLIFRQAGTQDR